MDKKLSLIKVILLIVGIIGILSICLIIIFNSNDYIQIKTLDIIYGITSLSIILLIFIKLKKINSFNELRLFTLTKFKIIVMINISLILYWFSVIYHYFINLAREEYNPLFDSIGIPIYYESISILFFGVLLNIALLFILRKYTYPTIMYLKIIKNKLLNELIIIFLLFILLVFLIGELLSGNIFSIISLLLMIYIVLCLRSGIYANKIENNNS